MNDLESKKGNSPVYETEYFVVYKDIMKGRKTPVYHIRNKIDRGIGLGIIKWYSPWRKYCFFSCDGIVWDKKCLVGVIDFLDLVNKKSQ